ncbi:MAG: hypothetical protein DWQ07_21595 [Chloroflexi bacterium]|nr:MAG: hypothetical protein DWQ07_21595 [Chloroflexota bacterium]MBL1196583.1 hypothetical protein [Chloroflexota bacterium]NOH13878.1 hypothetical protein [Chloroflexota bacterium]
MTTKLAESTNPPESPDTFPPFAPSVVDRFLAWVSARSYPAWFFYFALLTYLIVIFNGLAWVDGTLQTGTFDLYRSSVPVYPVSVFALIHYLNHVARRALTAFRPALGAKDKDYKQLEYQLVTLPRNETIATFALSLIFTAVYISFTPYLVDLFRRSFWLAFVEAIFYALAFGMIAVLFYHTIRQLRMVSHIHASATEVNLFRLTPLYAFSGLTAQTGIGLLLMNYFGVLTDPATFENLALTALTVGASFIAIACFLLPLRGIHQRIVEEKKRLRTEASTRLEATIQQVYARADSKKMRDAEQLNHLMTSLVTTRDIIDKIPTWPWEQGTLTSFVSALLLPFFVRLIVGLVGIYLL